MKIVSIDPGLKGGYVEAEYRDGVTTILRAIPLPHIKETNPDSPHKSRSRPRVTQLSNLMGRFNPDVVLIEHQHARPGYSLIAACTQMQNYGALLTLSELNCDNVMCVYPMMWQSKMIPGADKGESKLKSISYSQEHYPDKCTVMNKRSVVEHDGIADAICIVDYYTKYRM